MPVRPKVNHIRTVLNAGPGDTVACGRVNGRLGVGVIHNMDDTRLVMQVALDQAPPPGLPLNLVLALPGQDAPADHPERHGLRCQADLSGEFLAGGKSFWQSPFLEQDNLMSYARLGLEQARDTVLPEIHKNGFSAGLSNRSCPAFPGKPCA